MYIHFGQKPYGKCDVVPELFYVATWFFHFDYIPLVPMGTRLILGQSGNTYHVINIPFSLKSLAYAWLRLASFGAMVGCAIAALTMIDDAQRFGDWTSVEMSAISAAFFGILFAFLMIYPRRKMPTYERACQLARHAKLNEKGWAALNVLYGRDPLEIPVAA